MIQYLDIVEDIMTRGFDRKNERTGEVTRSLFGVTERFNLQEEFPIVKAKFTAFKTMSKELLWFLKGGTNIRWLQENNCHIWDEWADENGDLGPVYGKQWRSWTRYEPIRTIKNSTILGNGEVETETQVVTRTAQIDQIANVIDKLKNNPSDRRIMVNAFNIGELQDMKLPPCHYTFQFYVDNKNRLSCMWNQRSVDTFLGLPFNIASYALLTHMIAQVCNLEVGELIFVGGDTHIYHNHFPMVEEMMSRPIKTEKAKLWLNPAITDIDHFTIDDIRLDNYHYHPKIEAPVAV
jgi:thymidylate synthase